MALLNLNEETSERGSVAALAEVFEQSPRELTISEALMQLRVYDPARQRSLAAAFLKECRAGGKYRHLVGTKVRPSTTARGRSSGVFDGIEPLAPQTAVIRRSDAFQGIRAIDRSRLSPDLCTQVDNVSSLNLTGKAGTAVNRMAVEFDHSLELERVKRENAMTLAEERLKTLERLMEMLDRFADAAGADPNSRRVRSRPTQEAAE